MRIATKYRHRFDGNLTHARERDKDKVRAEHTKKFKKITLYVLTICSVSTFIQVLKRTYRSIDRYFIAHMSD